MVIQTNIFCELSVVCWIFVSLLYLFPSVCLSAPLSLSVYPSLSIYIFIYIQLKYKLTYTCLRFFVSLPLIIPLSFSLSFSPSINISIYQYSLCVLVIPRLMPKIAICCWGRGYFNKKAANQKSFSH